MNEQLLNVSSSPHIRSKHSTRSIMTDVIIALMPATLFGIYHFGLHAFLVVAASILSAVLTEAIFDLIAKKPMTIKDGSAVLTGLLLGISLPPAVPVFIPIIGGIVAILLVKCLFGGLGKNFMNPALAGRCFLLISFGTLMTNYSVDGTSTATPLALLRDGEAVNLLDLFIGNTTGVIGCSALALLIGAVYLLIRKGITWQIPFSCIAVFLLIMGICGEFTPSYLFAQFCGGGLLMGAFFMATDPVTSPITSRGHLIYGAVIGALAALFRIKGSAADSFSYAIIITNLLTPFLDKLPVPKPLGYAPGKEGRKFAFPKAAVNLTVITLIAGAALSAVYGTTKDTINEQKLAASAASYKEVCPDAEEFGSDETLNAAVEALEGAPYNTELYGKTYIDQVIVGKAADGSVAGYVIVATSGDGFDGDITLSLGISADGTLNGISFTELNETAGMGMKVEEDEFRSQFAGVQVDQFKLNKAGGSTADNEIDSVTGASITSGAVVNAVNTALAFFAENIQ